MKKNYFKFLIITLAATLTITFILPFNYISAESQTYYLPVEPLDTNKDNRTNNYWKVQTTNENIRVCFTGSSVNAVAVYAVSLTQQYSAFRIYNGYTNTWGSWFDITYSKTYNGVTYYYTGPQYCGNSSDNSDILVNKIPYSSNFNTQMGYVYNYTFGDYAVDPIPPTPPVQVGDLTFNYYTDFASNTQNTINSMKSNKDTITWDYDFNNSNISALDLKVDIRAIPVNYYSATEEDLKSLSWNSLNFNASLYADLGSYHINYNMRKVSYTWEEVVDKISYISNLPDIYNNLVNDWNFKIFNLNNYYYWTGWIYQIRLNTDSGDYVGEWHTIYQVSSAPPVDSSTVINYYVNSSGVTEPIYQSIQNINNQNNITNNTWYVNGSPFNVDDDSTSNWWEQLLQFIRDIVAEILGFLGSIFDSLISAILELVNSLGIDFLGLITQIINGIVDFFDNLDLNGSNFVLPSSFNNLIQSLSGSTNGILNIWFNNGLGMFIMIPLIIWLIGVVL